MYVIVQRTALSNIPFISEHRIQVLNYNVYRQYYYAKELKQSVQSAILCK
jgi:hypothetical protein